MKKLYCVIWGKYRNFKKHKTSYILEKTLVHSIIVNVKININKYLKKNNQLKY